MKSRRSNCLRYTHWRAVWIHRLSTRQARKTGKRNHRWRPAWDTRHESDLRTGVRRDSVALERAQALEEDFCIGVKPMHVVVPGTRNGQTSGTAAEAACPPLLAGLVLLG